MKIRMKPKPKIKKKIFRLDTIQPMKVERLKEQPIPEFHQEEEKKDLIDFNLEINGWTKGKED